MRYVKIFLLNFQQAFAFRSTAFIWFLTALINVGGLMLFWTGAPSTRLIHGWSSREISTYYLFMLITSALLMPHQEHDVARLDIKQGGLAMFLLKPFPYVLVRFFSEIPWRFMGGIFAIITAGILLSFTKIQIVYVHSLPLLLLACLISFIGFTMAFIFKMILGLMAFWITEVHGLFETTEVIMVITVGYLMPIALLPNWLANIAYFSPFPYIVYFPTIIFEGKISLAQLFPIVAMQLLWFVVLFILYRAMWKKGIRKFSAIGQ